MISPRGHKKPNRTPMKSYGLAAKASVNFCTNFVGELSITIFSRSFTISFKSFLHMAEISSEVPTVSSRSPKDIILKS